MASYTSNWGYADKAKDSKFSVSAGEAGSTHRGTFNTGKILEVKLAPVTSFLQNGSTSYTLDICGDWEADSAFIVSRFILHSPCNECNLLAMPALQSMSGTNTSEAQRQILVVAPGNDETALAVHQETLKNIQIQIRIQLGLNTKRSVSEGGWVLDGSIHLPAALLMFFASHLLLGKWFKIALEDHPGALCIATKLPGHAYKYDADCDVIVLDSLSLCHSTQNIRISFNTFVYRLLSAQPILKLGVDLERPLYTMHSKKDTVSTTVKISEAARESLRILRAGQPLIGLHDTHTYEYNLGKATSILHYQGLSEAPAVKDDGFLTEFEKRMQHMGYLSYLPSHGDFYCRYWHLRCGSGLSSGPGFPQRTSIGLANKAQRHKMGKEEDSIDSQDSLDIFEDSSATVTVPPTIATAKEEVDEDDVVEAQLRVAPAAPPEYVNSGKQCATLTLPRALVTAGLCEIPFLTRTRSEHAVSLFLRDTQQCSMVSSASVAAPDLQPFSADTASAAGSCRARAHVADDAVVGGSSDAMSMTFKFTPASALRRAV